MLSAAARDLFAAVWIEGQKEGPAEGEKLMKK